LHILKQLLHLIQRLKEDVAFSAQGRVLSQLKQSSISSVYGTAQRSRVHAARRRAVPPWTIGQQWTDLIENGQYWPLWVDNTTE